MANPFRNPQLAKMFDACLNVAADNFEEFYIPPARDFSAPGPRMPRNGAAHRVEFWRGYNGAIKNWDRYSKQTLAYAAYRAGEAFRKARA